MSPRTRVVLVALPLMARSGVYRSTHDLVRAAAAAGHDWRAVVGMRPDASGEPMLTDGVREVSFGGRGLRAVNEIGSLLLEAPEVRDADVVISLITQSDVAIARLGRKLGRPWIAWVRGKPWPAAGEQGTFRRMLIRHLESQALRAADDVWATTQVLAAEFVSARVAAIVPAGIAHVERIAHGSDGHAPLVWAGRVDVDKRPGLFIDIVDAVEHPGRIHGAGPLEATLRSREADVHWAGWTDASGLWDDASIFIGTSSREAFGRSAVEAAAAGLPVVLGANYGAAPLLFTDDALRDRCVIESSDPRDWATAVRRLLDDRALREAVSQHVHRNARTLTIDGSVQRATERIDRVLSGGRR